MRLLPAARNSQFYGMLCGSMDLGKSFDSEARCLLQYPWVSGRMAFCSQPTGVGSLPGRAGFNERMV
jgi:hypothetical protein